MLGSFGGFDVFPALQEWGTQQISPSEQTTILRAADELRDVHRIEAHCAGAALSLVLHGPHKRHTPGASLTVYASRMDTYVGPRYESLTMHLLATEDLGKAALGMGGPGTKILELTDHMFTSRPDWLPPYEQRRIHAAACLLQNLTKMYA